MIHKKKVLGLRFTIGSLSDWHGLNVVFSFAVDLEIHITFPSFFNVSCHAYSLREWEGNHVSLCVCKIPPFHKIDVK